MKVAYCIRPEFRRAPGGDTVQLLQTSSELEKRGIQGTIVCDPEELSAGYDVAHIFNLQTRDLSRAFARRARALGIRTSLSTIFWDFRYAVVVQLLHTLKIRDFTRGQIGLMLKLLGCTGRLISKPYYFSRRLRDYLAEMLGLVDVLLPNSAEELELLGAFSGMDLAELKKRSVVVYNAGDFGNDEKGDSSGLTGYALQVGRIEPLKNQHTLIEALFKEDLPILFVGRAFHPKYASYVRQLGARRGNVHFLDEVSHDALRPIYEKAAVHVLPSFRESPGLVSLEALSAGCKVVVSDRRFCPVQTYFDGIATVVDPTDPASVRAGVLEEVRRPRDSQATAKKIAAEFSWSVAAMQTRQGYELALAGG